MTPKEFAAKVGKEKEIAMATMSPKEFAVMLRATLAVHEASYDGNWKYAETIRQSAEKTCPKPWAILVACLLTNGYADVWEWCDEVEAG